MCDPHIARVAKILLMSLHGYQIIHTLWAIRFGVRNGTTIYGTRWVTLGSDISRRKNMELVCLLPRPCTPLVFDCLWYAEMEQSDQKLEVHIEGL